MRRFALLCLATLCACGGGGSVVPSNVNLSNGSGTTAGSPGSQPTLLWIEECSLCFLSVGIANTVAIDVVRPSGVFVNSLTYQYQYQLPLASFQLATSPNQQHVYATIARDGDNYILDINPQTFIINYIHIPIAVANGSFGGLVVSPDGKRLYAPMFMYNGSGELFVIDTTACVSIAEVPVNFQNPAITPDGRTIFGTSNVLGASLVAFDTTTMSASTAPANVGSLLVASATRLYSVVNSGTQSTVEMYEVTSPYSHLGEIVLPIPNEAQLTGVALDPSVSRLFVSYIFYNSNLILNAGLEVIDTATNVASKNVSVPGDALYPGGTLAMALDSVTHVLYTNGGQICAIPTTSLVPSCSAEGIGGSAFAPQVPVITTSN